MAYRRRVPIQNITGVGAGQTASIDLPPSRRYHGVMLHYTESGTPTTLANTDAAIEEIEILLNARTQRKFSAAELRVMNAYHGAPFAFQNGLLPIYFSEPWRRTPGDEDFLAWALEGNGIESFQIRVKVASGRTAPALAGRAIFDNARMPDGKLYPLGRIMTTRRRNIDVSGTGARTLLDMPRNLGDLAALHCFENTANDISALRISVEQNEAYNLTRAQANAYLTAAGKVPQTAVFHAAMDDTGRAADVLPMRKANGMFVDELQIEFDMAVANNFTMIAEFHGGPL